VVPSSIGASRSLAAGPAADLAWAIFITGHKFPEVSCGSSSGYQEKCACNFPMLPCHQLVRKSVQTVATMGWLRYAPMLSTQWVRQEVIWRQCRWMLIAVGDFQIYIYIYNYIYIISFLGDCPGVPAGLPMFSSLFDRWQALMSHAAKHLQQGHVPFTL
jgi:hypothetical protein